MNGTTRFEGRWVSRFLRTLVVMAIVEVTASRPLHAVVYSVTIDGSDAIFLASRTDLVIPPAGDPWTGPGDYLIRHAFSTPEEVQETLPPMIPVAGGDVIRALDPAIGGVEFFNGFGPPYFGPSGNGLAGSSLTALGGISGLRRAARSVSRGISRRRSSK